MADTTVPEVLQGYADRGLLSSFSVAAENDFGFLWLSPRPMQVHWAAATRSVVFKDVLPNIPARSAMYRDLRAFLKGRTDAALPAHRRVDPAAFELFCRNRRSRVSIGLRLVEGTEEEAAHKLMLVIHEVFLMMNSRWAEYMHEEFGASPE